MGNKVLDLLDAGEADNGTRALLTEIRKHQKDMPLEVRDDMTFGALVVLYDLGKARAKRLHRVEKWLLFYGPILMFLFGLDIALHSEVPWLLAILDRILG